MDPKPNGTECSFTPALSRCSRDSSPPVSTLQYVRGDTEYKFSPSPTPVDPPFEFLNPPLPARISHHRECPVRGSRPLATPTRSPYQPSCPPPPPRTHRQAQRPATQPSPGHTTKNCSLTLCTNSGTQRYPPTNFGVLEIKREQAGRKTTDPEVFTVLRKIYYGRLRPLLQRLLSFRALKHIVLVEFTKEEQLTPLVMDAKLRRDIIHVFNKPHLISTDNTWVNWICDLGEDPDHDYGVLFVHDWDRQKIAVVVGIPWVISVVTAIGWIAGTGDIANAMAVSSYIMSATGVVVGLLAVLSAVEA